MSRANPIDLIKNIIADPELPSVFLTRMEELASACEAILAENIQLRPKVSPIAQPVAPSDILGVYTYTLKIFDSRKHVDKLSIHVSRELPQHSYLCDVRVSDVLSGSAHLDRVSDVLSGSAHLDRVSDVLSGSAHLDRVYHRVDQHEFVSILERAILANCIYYKTKILKDDHIIKVYTNDRENIYNICRSCSITN